MSYSIVVLNYNNSKETINLVNSILNYQNLDYVVIVDNNSASDQLAMLSNYVDVVKNAKIYFFKNIENSGYSRGNNIGLRILKNDLQYNKVAVIMNPDVKVSEENLNRVVLRCQKLPAAILSPNVTSGKSWWEFTDYKSTILNTFFHLRKKNVDMGEFDNNENILKKVDVLSGAILVAKMSTWGRIGFFDENTFLYFEEEILQYKAHKMGIYSYIVVGSTYRHQGGTSTNVGVKKRSLRSIWAHEWRIQKSREYYFRQYLSVNKIKMIFLRLVFLFYTPLIILKRLVIKEGD